MTDKPSYNELTEKLREAEEILDVLRGHKADAVIGTDQIAIMRLKEVEDRLQDQIQITENQLREIESIYKNVPVGLGVLDTGLRFIRVNDYLAGMLGIPAADHLGKTVTELLPEPGERIRTDLQEVIKTGKSRMNVDLVVEVPAFSGMKYHWRGHWLPLFNKKEEVVGINMVIEDITDRKEYEKKLHRLNDTLEERVKERTKIAEQRADKLREMALQMTEVEEKERQRLSRVLHDGLQQLLIGARFQTGLIKKQLSEQEKLKKSIEDVDVILKKAIEASRSLSYELSPPVLHDQGLFPALQRLIEMPHMKGLKVRINKKGDLPELSQNLKTFFFQAVRELLTNIIKHAEADEAEIRLWGENGDIIVEVIDRGKGFDQENVEKNSISQGLRNIKEKLELMNGRMDIASKPGEGSHFTMRVPSEGHFPSPS